MESTIDHKEHAAYAAANMAKAAEQQACMYAEEGTHLEIRTQVHVADGYRNWAGALTKALIEEPALAGGSRQDMADLIQKKLSNPLPFPAYRLSKPLTDKARKLVAALLAGASYAAAKLTNGLSIRDAIRAGTDEQVATEATISTTFEPDGVCFGERKKFYPYETVLSYEDKPWYRLGIRFQGTVIPLGTVLAMRGIGISQFIDADESAMKRASVKQRAARDRLLKYH